ASTVSSAATHRPEKAGTSTAASSANHDAPPTRSTHAFMPVPPRRGHDVLSTPPVGEADRPGVAEQRHQLLPNPLLRLQHRVVALLRLAPLAAAMLPLGPHRPGPERTNAAHCLTGATPFGFGAPGPAAVSTRLTVLSKFGPRSLARAAMSCGLRIRLNCALR